MHSVDFWTREQILCVSKVDETKAMCARKAFCFLLYLPKQSNVEKSNLTLPHQHPNSSTMRHNNSTFQGKDVDHAICQCRFCCPRAVTSGGRFLSLRKPPLHASVACTWETPLLWHASCPSALAEHIYNKHITWPTFPLEPALPPPLFWEVTSLPYYKELQPTSDYSYSECLPKSDISTWKEFLGNQNRHIKSSLSS